jgi:release factor glutamine methyltransferase
MSEIAQVADRRATEFDGLTIAFDRRVLEPRRWTGMQSRWAAELASRSRRPIVELYAGVGHIGLAAARRSGRRLIQVDVDPIACAYAEENARRAGLAHRTTVRCCDVDAALRDDEEYSVVIADPPYLTTKELATFPDDPKLAVDGGDDGLTACRRCLAMLRRRLRHDAPVLLQLRGSRQVERLLSDLPEGVIVDDMRTDGPHHAVILLHAMGPRSGALV